MDNFDFRDRFEATELFLGCVAPVGISSSSFIDSLGLYLRPFGYSVKVWRLSKFMAGMPGLKVKLDDTSEARRLETAMTMGNELRERAGATDILARLAVLEVQRSRGGDAEVPPAPQPRTLHVFWSLKHPDEVFALRRIYGAGFHLLGLYASEEVRLAELRDGAGVPEAEARKLIDRDFQEGGHGQRTRDAFHLADYFLHWEGTQDDRAELRRFLDLMFGNPYITPREEEHAMFLAFASSLRSGELSRQVGATLVSGAGDVVAVGANDVPKAGGGLYWPVPDEADKRDYKIGYDSNQRRRNQVIEETLARLNVQLPIKDALELLKGSPIMDITEYGRAVHAEMEAIMSCARSGTSTRGASLYVTTFPCHNCARHIIDAGVARVVYVEPYPKSRALQLHPDAILSVSPKASVEAGKVVFEPFMGAGPRRYTDYFSLVLGSGYELIRKDKEGNRIAWEKGNAYPRIPAPPASYLELELLAIEEVADLNLGENEENEDEQ